MSDVDKAAELARDVIAHPAFHQRDEVPDLARALLAVIAERDQMAKVCEAAEALAEVDGVSFAGPGQYAAAGCSLQLREAIEALDAIRAARKATP